MTPSLDLLDFITKGGVVAVLLLILVGFYTERIVPRGRLEEMREHWKDTLAIAERLADVAEARELREEREERSRR